MPLMNSTGALKLQRSVVAGNIVLYTNYFDTINTGILETGKYSSTGSTCVVGDVPVGGGVIGGVIRTNSYGNITNQITLNGATGNTCRLADVVFDSTDTLYVCGDYSLSGFPTAQKSVTIKFDNTLNVVWQKQLYDTTGWRVFLHTMAYHPSTSDIYVGGIHQSSGSTLNPLLAKYDSNGNLLFQKYLSNTGTRTVGLHFDSSNNYYCCVINQISNYGVEVSKWNSSDVYQWSVRINTFATVSWANSVTDSSGNTYVLVLVSNQMYVVKLDNTGSIVWQNVFSGTYADLGGMAIDSSGNIYVSMYDSSSPNKVYVVKVNSSGGLVWQNYLTDSSGIQAGNRNNNLDWRNNKIWVGAYDWPSATTTYNWSLPDDGTLTGTYSNFSYLPGALTFSSSSLTLTTLVNTSSTSALTDANATLISSPGTFTQTVQAL